jgi:Fe(3+) dicitrate transport protein
LFSLGSIAQNKIAGVITDGDGKINDCRTTNIKVFTDATGAFEFDLKKSGSFDFVFFKEGYSIVEQNNITTNPHDCAEENHKPI